MLKKIINVLRNRNIPADIRRDIRDPLYVTDGKGPMWQDHWVKAEQEYKAEVRKRSASDGDVDWVRDAVADESNEAFKGIPSGEYREQCLRCLIDGIAFGGEWVGDREKAMARLSDLFQVHRHLSFDENEKARQERERERYEFERKLVMLPYLTTHKRVLLENQTLFSKGEWLARAAEGKHHPHSDDEFLGVPDDVLNEAKAAYEATKHEREEIVRHNGPYMITVNEEGVQVLKDVLAGDGGIEERETFEPITASQRKWNAAVEAQGLTTAQILPFAAEEIEARRQQALARMDSNDELVREARAGRIAAAIDEAEIVSREPAADFLSRKNEH